MTLLASYPFLKDGIESAIIKRGTGDEYDSTNNLCPEAVTSTAIAKVGIDHVGMLGDTYESIAWHKAGTMNSHVPAFAGQQVPLAHTILEERAAQKILF